MIAPDEKLRPRSRAERNLWFVLAALPIPFALLFLVGGIAQALGGVTRQGIGACLGSIPFFGLSWLAVRTGRSDVNAPKPAASRTWAALDSIASVVAGVALAAFALWRIAMHWSQVVEPGCYRLENEIESLQEQTSIAAVESLREANKKFSYHRVALDVVVGDVSPQGAVLGRCAEWLWNEGTPLHAQPANQHVLDKFTRLTKSTSYRFVGRPVLSRLADGNVAVAVEVEDVWGTGGLFGCAELPTTERGPDNVVRPIRAASTQLPWCN